MSSLKISTEVLIPTAHNSNDLYEVILIYSGVGYTALCPGIPGAVSQGTDREDALAMIADAMAMGLLHPLPCDDDPARRRELRKKGKVRIAELVAECERDGWKYEVCEVTPQLISPPVSVD